ncbi:histidine phosphatase family protein [Streptomyces sp900105755]|uniref:histidine phosphatase family protein n=1 Tax=Streptomyces sp. 900105755 TaxID=3154389 RepID=UPI00331DCE17
MSIHLTLLRAPCGDATPDPLLGDAPLSERDLRLTAAARAVLSLHGQAVRTPSTRCSQTADALGLTAVPEPMLRDLDVGDWRGRTVGEVAAADPDGFSAWRTDPDAAPHGGESVRELCRRSADWLSGMARGTGHTVVVTEAAVVRAVLIRALAMPARTFWHLSVPPLDTVLLTWRGGYWDVRFGYGSLPESRRRPLSRPTAVRLDCGADGVDGKEFRQSGPAPSWPFAQFPAPHRRAVQPQRTSPDPLTA